MSYVPRLKERYRTEIVPALMEEFSYENIMQVPRLEKVVVNVGAGEALQNAKSLDAISRDLMTITGQRPIILSLIHISEPTRLKTRSRMPSSA